MSVGLFSKMIRSSLSLLCLAVGVLLLAQHLGAKTYGCGLQCGQTGRLWFSPIFLGAVILASIADLVLIFRKDWESYQALARAQAAAALLAFGLSVGLQMFCPLCLTVQIAWLAMGFESFQRKFARAFAVVLLGTAIYVFLAAPKLALAISPPSAFAFRAYEGRIVGSPGAIVVFTDPLCPWCRAAASRLDESHVPIPVLHRWLLLPQHGSNAVKVAALIESAEAVDAVKGRELERTIFTSALDPIRGKLIEYGVRAGFGADTVARWFDEPEAPSLTIIKADGELGANIGVQRVPAPCVVNTIFASGGGPHISMLGEGGITALTSATGRSFEKLHVLFGH